MDLITYALAKKYMEQTLNGLGALKGSPCIVESSKDIGNATEIVFKWNAVDGTVETMTTIIPHGNINIDDSLSTISENPVQNKIISQEIDNLVQQFTADILNLDNSMKKADVNIGNIYNEITSIYNYLNDKVDKINGMGLSSEDFTSAEKSKLAALTNIIVIKGRVDTVNDLPSQAEIGWFYFVGKITDSEYEEYCYSDNGWINIGTTTDGVDLTNYYNKLDVNNLLNSKVDKVAGKGLSTNDFTNQYLQQIEANTNDITSHAGKLSSITATLQWVHNNLSNIINDLNLKLDKSSPEYVPIKYITGNKDFNTDFQITNNEASKVLFSNISNSTSTHAPFGTETLPYLVTVERLYEGSVETENIIKQTVLFARYVGTANVEVGECWRLYKGGTTPTWSEWKNNKADGNGNVDSVLSTTSENPVQNKVVTTEIENINIRLGNLENQDLDVSADFLTKDGFGNLRFYNGKFQYYNTDTSAWTDCEVTDNNSYILQMVPQVMRKVLGWYDHNAGHYKLLFEEPADTVIDGQVATVVDSVYIVRKLGSMPESVDDADCVQVDVIDRSDFGIHKNKAYIDKSFTPSDGEIWYYKLIPHSTSGFYNNTNVNGTRGIEARDYFLLGYKVDKNDSNPSSRVTYTDDCLGFDSAAMDYTAGKFDYGTWNIVNPWFLSENKPCAVKFDGTVDYYMKADNYSLREDGTASDYNNVDYQGNMMAQMPKVYLKRWEDGNYRYCQISDKKINDDFKCYAHLNANQQELDYIYLPMFKGIIDSNGKMRSYAGSKPTSYETIATDISAAQACGKGWYIWDWSSFALIQDLLVLLGKSTDSQTIYGNGCSNTSSMLTTGELYLEGQFCGYTGAANHVKVFHIEDFYGNRWEGVLGLLSNNGVYYCKMFPDYNFDCTGYTDTTANVASAYGYISKCVYGEMGCMAISSGGSSTTYECDRVVGDGNGIKYPVFGSGFHSGEGISGCFGIDITVDVSFAATGIGTSPIFKSLDGGN